MLREPHTGPHIFNQQALQHKLPHMYRASKHRYFFGHTSCGCSAWAQLSLLISWGSHWGQGVQRGRRTWAEAAGTQGLPWPGALGP